MLQLKHLVMCVPQFRCSIIMRAGSTIPHTGFNYNITSLPLGIDNSRKRTDIV